jgi:hypothetical protein
MVSSGLILSIPASIADLVGSHHFFVHPLKEKPLQMIEVVLMGWADRVESGAIN